jgi:hypothetical protein
VPSQSVEKLKFTVHPALRRDATTGKSRALCHEQPPPATWSSSSRPRSKSTVFRFERGGVALRLSIFGVISPCQMSNIPDKILDGLLISNLAARSDEETLRSANIGTIVDLATLQV